MAGTVMSLDSARLKRRAENLAEALNAEGFNEAALLVGAAALSIGDYIRAGSDDVTGAAAAQPDLSEVTLSLSTTP